MIGWAATSTGSRPQAYGAIWIVHMHFEIVDTDSQMEPLV